MQLGKIVIIDLSSGIIQYEPFTPLMAKSSLGGFGFDTEYLYKNLPHGADPLGPENILVISCGLLTGTSAPSSSRLHLCAKSPQSGLMGSSNVGGTFAVKLKSIDIQALVIKGKADTPVSIVMDKDGVRLEEASHLWGSDTRKCREMIEADKPGEKLDIMCIGPAGENGVVFSCIMAGPDHAAGRTGLGAVMGSKNLKALVLTGQKVKTEKSPETARVLKKYIAKLKNNTERYTTYSTVGGCEDILELYDKGGMGARNFRENKFEGAERLAGSNLDKFVTKRVSCARCPVHCKAHIEIGSGRHKGFKGGRPEYETALNIGGKCGLFDPEEVLFLSNLPNILGMDTISIGGVIAFAMDLYDRGILTPENTDGFSLDWGDARAMEKLMHMIAGREGIGDILALGTRGAAQAIGNDSHKYAYHAKGMEIYGADPRAVMGLALSYAVSLRGGDFTSVYPIAEFRYTPERAKEEFGHAEAVDVQATKGKGALVAKSMKVSAVIDSVGLCKIPALTIIGEFDLENEAELIRSLLNIDITAQDLFNIGERIINMEKVFNLRHGATMEDDNLPDSIQHTPINGGTLDGAVIKDLDRMVADFYFHMGWDGEGVPTGRKLIELGLRPDSEQI